MRTQFFLVVGLLTNMSVMAATASRLIYGETGRLGSIDPYTVREASGLRLSDLLFDGLVESDPGGEYAPALAESWQISPDHTRVELVLKSNVVWHSKKSESRYFGPQDVIKTVELLLSKASEIPNQDRFEAIADVKRISDHRIIISYKRAVGDPLRLLTFKILPAHELESVHALTKDLGFTHHPIGTGPYRFTKLSDHGDVLLEANAKYFRGEPKIKNIVMKSFADDNVMAQSLAFSAIDMVTTVSPTNLGELASDRSLRIVPYDALSFSFIAINNTRDILKDQRIRQALGYAVNRQEMLKAFFNDNGFLISGPFAPTSWAYNLDVEPALFNPAHAQDLFQAAGLKRNASGRLVDRNGNPVKLTFVIPIVGESEMIKKIALAYQGYLDKVGIDLDLKFMDWLAWKDRVLKHRDFDLTIASWSFDDASNIRSLFHSSEIKPWGNNFVGFSDPTVDSLLVEAQVTNDYEKRRAIYHKIHGILAEAAPYTYLWTLKNHAAHQRRIVGVQVEPFAFFKHIATWALETEGDHGNRN